VSSGHISHVEAESGKTHELKTVQPYFDEVLSGRKAFECRLDDRGFQVGDYLMLREFVDGYYTGRQHLRRVVYILRDDFVGLQRGYCIMGLGRP